MPIVPEREEKGEGDVCVCYLKNKKKKLDYKTFATFFFITLHTKKQRDHINSNNCCIHLDPCSEVDNLSLPFQYVLSRSAPWRVKSGFWFGRG